MTARFYAESFAPWCERARWALDHHRVAYREIQQTPLVAELTLRVAAKTTSRVTVPLFVDKGVSIMESDAIARHADKIGRGAPLFPSAHERDIAAWMKTSEQIMIAGRALLLPRMLADRAALREQFRPVAMARLGVKHLMAKYAVRDEDRALHEDASRRALDRVRAAIARELLVRDAFSYADVTIAAALQFVRPADDRWIVLGPATRGAWTNDALVAEYADVLAWRDRLYATHRQSA